MKDYKNSVTSFSQAEVFCDSCGDSCMHEGFNYLGISMDISGCPKSLVDKVGFHKFSACYPCWFKSMGLNKVHNT